MHVYVFTGLSKVITDLLHPVGMPRTRSHELPVHVGAASVPVHSLIDIGGSYCLRCEPESIYRSVQAVGHAALVVKLHPFAQIYTNISSNIQTQ